MALRINGYAQLVGPDGEPVGDVAKSPAFGTNWVTVDDLNPYELASGHAPADDDEIVIDKASADKAGYQPGDVATVLTKSEPRQFTIAGIATFGTADSPAGATAVLFTDAAATELLATPGQADAIAVTADAGWSQADVVAAVQAAVGGDVEVITGAALIAEDQASMAELLAGMGDDHRGLRLRRRVRRRVHHQQHVLDHRRPAHPRDGDAACDRRVRPAGQALGADRGRSSSASSHRRPVSPPASAWPPGCGS